MNADKIEGYLEVGRNDKGEVIVNHPELKPDENGIRHIVFSPNQARNLARLLEKHATEADEEMRQAREAAQRRAAESIPVDRTARTLADGRRVTADHREINPFTGQQKDYVVLSAAERGKGFVRPVRNAYIHVGKPPEGEDYSRFEYPIRGGVRPYPGGCLTRTQMSQSIAETYARDPEFYSGTFCCSCREHRPLEEFIWEGTTERVGS